MSLMAAELLREGILSASLQVLRENHVARGFYERLGGSRLNEREQKWGDVTLTEVVYGWPDLYLLVPPNFSLRE